MLARHLSANFHQLPDKNKLKKITDRFPSRHRFGSGGPEINSKKNAKEFLYLYDEYRAIQQNRSRRRLRLAGMKINRLHALFVGLMLFAALGSAQAQNQERLRLVRADKLEQFMRGNVPVKKLTGNVLFEKGQLQLACELAYWFEQEQRAEFLRKVVVTKEKKVLKADTLTFYNDRDLLVAHGQPVLTDDSLLIRAKNLSYLSKDEIAHARGAVYLEDGPRNVTAQRVTYFSREKKSIAREQAQINDAHRRTALAADSLIYFNDTGNIEAFLKPVLTRFDSSGAETFRIRAELISLNEKDGNFLAQEKVEIWREDFTAYARTLTYLDSLEIATLTENPRVVSDGQELTGKLMTLHFRDENLHTLRIDANARANAVGKAYLPADTTGKTRGDSVKTYDEITGKFMEIYFREGQADSVLVYGMATSQYNVLEDSLLKGLNEISGDTIRMKFRDRKLATIVVIGGTEGQFVPHATNRDLDTTVVYRAQRIDYFFDTKLTDLYQNAAIRAGDVELTAGKISVHWNENLLYANPLFPPPYDSGGTDLPTLYQTNREPFAGENMVYNLKTQRGRIIEGKTREQDGYYYGDNIAKVDKKVFYVSQGLYTTCDAPEPHFYFRSNQMKLIFKDKIIARPIVLYIHGIPLLGLPFGIFPNQGGRRHSGWLMPTYGDNKNTGGYIRGLGYFWAPSDYYDFRLTTDFYDKKGVIFEYRTRYALRYKFDGSIGGRYTNSFFADIPERKWTLDIQHHQPLSPTMRLNADGHFVSKNDDYYRRMGINRDTRLDQQLISNATLSKSWPGTPYAMSMNLNQTVNLQAKTLKAATPTRVGEKFTYISRALPNVSFTRSQKPLVPLKAYQERSRARWYNNIYFSTSSQLRNRQDIFYQSNDSLDWVENDIKKSAITHALAFNTSQKLLGFITLNQNANFDEGWVFEYDEPLRDSTGGFVIERGAIKSRTVSGFKARHTGSASLNAQTKVYGLFPLRVAGLQAVRHVMTPSVGLRYQPDFTKTIFGWNPGYVQSWTDSTGRIWTFDPLRSTMLGATPSGEQKSLTMGLSNIVQAKVGKGAASRKFDLFTLNSSTSYNFAADSLRWAPISTNFRTQVTKKIAINLSAHHDLYAFENNRRVNKWHRVVKGIPLPRLTSVSASTGFTLNGKRFGTRLPTPSPTGELTDTTETDLLNPSYSNAPRTPGTSSGASEGGELWSASFSLRYSQSSYDPAKVTKTFWMSTSLRLNVTSKWHVSHNASFDLITKRLVNQDFRVERDLHCWDLAFSWTPSGFGKQYSLLINVKSPTLRDLKYEERGGRRRGFGF